MGLSSSLIVVAVGAVLRWAVTVRTRGINLQTTGLVLMVVGGLGVVTALFLMFVGVDRPRGGPLR